MMYCCGVLFFFKQKTAYEMRISDWSSDVCSSDLHWPRPGGLWARLRHRAPLARPWLTDDGRPLPPIVAAAPAAAVKTAEILAGQIGRASCRERVCPSV